MNGFKKKMIHISSDGGNNSSKRLSLKGIICEIHDKNELTAFEILWKILKKATIAVFENSAVEFTMEELYRNVENMCTQKLIMELHSSVKALCVEYVMGFIPVFLNEQMQLGAVAQNWNIYRNKMLLIRNIFMFMDRQLPYSTNQCTPIWDMALSLFCDRVITIDSVQTRIIKQLLEEIHKERCGNTVDRQLLRTIVYMLIDLKLYEPVFLSKFIHQSQQFYAEESDVMTRELSAADYLLHVDSRLSEEEDRLLAYLDPNVTRLLLSNAMIAELLTRPLDHLLEAGLVSALKGKEVGQLKLFYFLLSKVSDGINKLRTHFRKYLIDVGRETVENRTADAEKDRSMIQTLLDFREYMTNIISSCFMNDAAFTRVLQEAYEEFLNQRPNKPAEFLAKYLDSHMRSGNKIQTEDELDRLMDKVMIFFRYINGKDMFQAFYNKELAKRLLNNKSASIDAEKAMLSKLKQECGPNYTRKMEVMFQDIELSKQLSTNFHSHFSPECAIELSVNVICPASWPIHSQSKVNHPTQMKELLDEYTRFYVQHHQGRKLVYEPSLGNCVVKAQFPSMPTLRKELHVTEFQTLILLQFNDIGEDESVSYRTIAETTGIPEADLKRTLLSLSAGKGQRVLIKQPNTVEVGPDDQFRFNKDFRHRLTRIKFNHIQMKETKQEQEETEERVFADRVWQVDCCVVRIMKTRKKADHNNLLSEVYRQLQFPLKASDVKKRIENLIERDYLKRDSENAAIYHYVS